MEEKITTEAIMPYGKMKEYLSEWYYEPQFSLSAKAGEYDSNKIFHILKENYTGEVVFVWEADMYERFGEDTMVSTAGIVGDELRGLIEQCYELDKRLEADMAAEAAPAVANSQKGE